MNAHMKDSKIVNAMYGRKHLVFLTGILFMLFTPLASSLAAEDSIQMNKEIAQTHSKSTVSPTFCDQWIYYRDYNMRHAYEKAFREYALLSEGSSDLRLLIKEIKEDTRTWYDIDATSQDALGIGMFAQSIKLTTDLLKDAISSVDKRAKHINTASDFVECQLLKITDKAPLFDHSIDKCIKEIAEKRVIEDLGEKIAKPLLKQYSEGASIYAKMQHNLYKLASMPHEQKKLKDDIGRQLKSSTNRLEQHQNRMRAISPSVIHLNRLVVKLNGFCGVQNDIDKALEEMLDTTMQAALANRNQTYNSSDNLTRELNDTQNEFGSVINRINAKHSQTRSEISSSANNMNPINALSGFKSRKRISIHHDTCQADDGNGEVQTAIENGLNQGYSIEGMVSLVRQQIVAYRTNLNALDLRYEEHRKIKAEYEESIIVNQAVLDALECMKQKGNSMNTKASLFMNKSAKDEMDSIPEPPYQIFEPKIAPINDDFADYCGIDENCGNRLSKQNYRSNRNHRAGPASKQIQRGVR